MRWLLHCLWCAWEERCPRCGMKLQASYWEEFVSDHCLLHGRIDWRGRRKSRKKVM